MSTKKYILLFLLIGWMCLIFGFSSQNGNDSSSTHGRFTSKIIDIVSFLTRTEISEEKRMEIIDETSFIVRKTAHFFLYFVLGFLFCFNLKEYSIKNVFWFSVLFCFCYACTDEFHQLFVPGRSGQVKDIFIDTFGSFVSCSFYTLIRDRKKVFRKIGNFWKF